MQIINKIIHGTINYRNNLLTIEITYSKALPLVKQLEELHLVKFVAGKNEDSEKLRAQALLRGKLNRTTEQYKEVHQYVKEIRNEWRTGV